ncbi:unnamed protein product [Moneuplotes crassus]|uniref:Rab-GAP TBC domain-containing protein n=1 Tax=Euplotes crassus TaxID=5936 RepID=A0AAD1U2D8_EUPCR|nr:unnamed protein product [Moneuplotes crassus]
MSLHKLSPQRSNPDACTTNLRTYKEVIPLNQSCNLSVVKFVKKSRAENEKIAATLTESIYQKDIHALIRMTDRFTEAGNNKKRVRPYKIKTLRDVYHEYAAKGCKRVKKIKSPKCIQDKTDFPLRKIPLFSTHHVSEKKLDKSQWIKMRNHRSPIIVSRNAFITLQKRRNASKNLTNITSIPSKVKVCKDNQRENLDLRVINTNLLSKLNQHKCADSTTFDSNKCSLVSSLNFKCICGIGSNMHHCEAAQRWTEYAYRHHSRSFDFEKDSEIFNDMLTLAESDSAVQESVQQIKNDICRTVTDEEFFCVGGRGYTTMLEVLTAFALYDKPCGYVQGMNFITASLAYHCDSATAFWLFASLIEDYDLRKNYLQGFDGFYKCAKDIGEESQEKIPKIFKFLVSSQKLNFRKTTA